MAGTSHDGVLEEFLRCLRRVFLGFAIGHSIVALTGSSANPFGAGSFMPHLATV